MPSYSVCKTWMVWVKPSVWPVLTCMRFWASRKASSGIGDAAVLGGVQLIQQVVQRLPGLAGQQRKVAAGGILRLAQEVDRAAQAVKTLSEKALGIIGVALGQDGAVGHTLAV